jgi:hypothetical protein
MRMAENLLVENDKLLQKKTTISSDSGVGGLMKNE